MVLYEDHRTQSSLRRPERRQRLLLSAATYGNALAL